MVECVKPTGKAEKTAFEVLNEAVDITIDLEGMADMLGMLIEHYNLASEELTEYQQLFLTTSHRPLYNMLQLIQSRLYKMNEQIDSISLKKDLDPEEKE